MSPKCSCSSKTLSASWCCPAAASARPAPGPSRRGRRTSPAEGRDKFDLSGFTCPGFRLEESEDALVVTTDHLRLSIRLRGLYCRWDTMVHGKWQHAASDRATQNYNWGLWDNRVYHYLARHPDEKYFGLGERAGDANRAGQSYRMTNVDAMGYNARTTDPLYKHIPFYITWRSSTTTPLGLFYDTLADCTFDMGRELDNYHGHYRYFVAEFGDLDYYVIGGESIAEITRRYTWLTGRPAFMPRWSLGYSGSTMSYTDAPDAQLQMDEFLAKCAEYDIPCESFHLSSGYTSIGPNRYVFNWNRDKFPDPAGFARRWLDHGVRLCANIKPCLLHDHPRFAEAARDGLFIHDPDGTPSLVQFWDEVGAYLDFTNAKTRAWWKDGVKTALLEFGIASTWNDNNEFEVWSDQARIDGFGQPASARESKILHTLLMLQASRQAQREHAPDARPFMISRAGAAGMQRYVQTWSGDNYTSWETLRYNIRMGTGLALSGISNTGHDIGGFSGPKPEPELFLRWVQFGIFLPRFSIHSWNDDFSANEPWMYPEITPQISGLIKLRQKLIPYFYDLLWRYHDRYEPMIRPTLHDFPDDPRCFEENDDMLPRRPPARGGGGREGRAGRVASICRLARTGTISGAASTSPADRRSSLPRHGIGHPCWRAPGRRSRSTWPRRISTARPTSAALRSFPIAGQGTSPRSASRMTGRARNTALAGMAPGRSPSHPSPARCGSRSAGRGRAPPPPGQVTLLLPAQERRRLTLEGGTIGSETEDGGMRRVSVAAA